MAKSTSKWDITNPTQARRIIFDGTPEQKKIEIMPGQTKLGVELTDDVAENFGDGSDRATDDIFMVPHVERATPAAKPAEPKTK